MIAEEATKTPLIKVSTNAKTPSSLYSKTKTAATSQLSNIKANLINKFTSSNPPVTPAANKINRATALNSVTRSIKVTKTFNNPTSTRNNFLTPVKAITTTAKQSNIKTPSTVHTFRTTNAITNKKLFNSAAKPASTNNATPVTSSNVNINVRKNISRTVDCAKTAIRRSIRLLNSPPGLSLTPNNPHRRNLFPSGTKIPVMKSVLDRDLSKTDGTHQRTVHLTKNDAKSIKRRSLARRSRLSTGLNEDSCFLITPKLMRQIIDSASKVKANNETIAEDEEEIKIQSIKPSSLLKYLLRDRHEGTSSELESVNENKQEPDQDISMAMEAITDEVETIAYEKQTSTDIPEQFGIQDQFVTKIVSPTVENESITLNETIDEPMQEEESTSIETMTPIVGIDEKPALEKSMSKIVITQTVLDNIDNLVTETNEINNVTVQKEQVVTIALSFEVPTSDETSSKGEEMDVTEETTQNDVESKEEGNAENIKPIITQIINNQTHVIIQDSITEVIEGPVLNKTDINESEPTMSGQETEGQKEEQPLADNEVNQLEMEIIDQVKTELPKDKQTSTVELNKGTQIDDFKIELKSLNVIAEPTKKMNVGTNQTIEFQVLQTKLYEDAIIINDSFEVDEDQVDAFDQIADETSAKEGIETQTNLTLEASHIEKEINQEFFQRVTDEPANQTPITEVPISEIPVFDESITKILIIQESVTETPVPIVEEPVKETQIVEAPIAEAPTAEEPVEETPIVGLPIAEAQIAETPIAEAQIAETPIAEDPAEAPIAESPIAEALISEDPVEETPIVIAPIAEAPIVEAPIAQAPISQAPIIEAPIAQAPISQAPIAETPIAEAPIAGDSIAEDPIEETPIVEAPIAEAPIAEAPIAESPIAESPISEDPVEETPIVEAPIVEAPITEEPLVESPVVEEPVEETPIVEELVTETSVAEVPIVEDKVVQLIETKKTRGRPAAKNARAKKKPTKDLEELTTEKQIEDTVDSKQTTEPVSSVTCIETQSNLTLESTQIEKEIKTIEVSATISEEEEQEPVEIKKTVGRSTRATRARATPVPKEPASKTKLVPKETPVAKEPAKRTTKRKQPLDDIQNKNEEAATVAEADVVVENDVKKRKYTRKNNKNQEIAEDPEKMVIEQTPVPEPVVEEVIKPKRVYKKRGAPEPEPVVSTNENSKPEVERISTRSQRAKITRKA